MVKHLFLSHLCLLNHGISAHPENSGRLKAIVDALEESPYKTFYELSVERKVKKEELCLIHTAEYIDQIFALEGQETYLDLDTALSSGSLHAALVASGIGLELIEKVLAGEIYDGFALVRPPGHHARPNSAMGFCIFNNIAIAAKKAISLGIRRIVIFDWDVHHGNGTQEAFYADDNVLFIDFHQENLFPFNSGFANELGNGKGEGFTCNVPLPEGCGDAEYLFAFDNIVKPLVLKYKPELILVSAGFDAHESDPLGGMKITTQGFGQLTARIKALANQCCQGKILFFLEGGYDPYFLAKNVLECIRVLVNEESPIASSPCKEEIKILVQKINDSHISYS